MSEVNISPNTKLDFRVINILSEAYSIYPRFRTDIEISKFTTNPNENVNLTNIFGKMYLTAKDGRNYYLSDIVSDSPVITLYGSGKAAISLYSNFDHFGISQIEELRENADLNLRYEIRFVYRIEQPSTRDNGSLVWIDHKISKSDWVEKLLTELRYKQVFLLEVPKLGNGEFSEVIQYLDDSWKKLAMGEYPEVLVSCQKSLEKVKELLKKKGYGKDDGKIDFSKFTETQTIAESLEGTWTKLISFLQPGGRHIGRTINKEDAEFAVLVAYALINVLIKNVSSA